MAQRTSTGVMAVAATAYGRTVANGPPCLRGSIPYVGFMVWTCSAVWQFNVEA
jgi:hypothetical protein